MAGECWVRFFLGRDLYEGVAFCCRFTNGMRGTPIEIPKEIRSLTGVRFFAAMWVVVFHAQDKLFELIPEGSGIRILVGAGHQAVPLFFILSGFILSHSYFPRYAVNQHREFILLRLARLWPCHVFMLAVFALFSVATNGLGPKSEMHMYSLSRWILELGMVRSWGQKELILNFPAWSISAEWFAYIFLFPLAFLSFCNLRRSALLFVISLALLVAHELIPFEVIPGRCAEIILLFLAGSVLYRWRMMVRVDLGRLLVLGAVVGFIGGLFLTPPWQGALLHFGSAALIVGLSFPNAYGVKLLSSKVCVYGGVISYAIYMSHFFVLKLFALFYKKANPVTFVPKWILFLGMLTAVVVFAAFVHRFIEAPWNLRIRKWGVKSRVTK